MATRQVAIRFDAELLERVRELAEKERRTPSAMIRILVEDALDARERARERRRT
jgi:predicted transcriptional regulator